VVKACSGDSPWRTMRTSSSRAPHQALFPPNKVRGQRRSNRPLTALRRLARPELSAHVGDTRPVRAKCLGTRHRRHQRPLLRVSIRRSGGGWRLIRCDVSPNVSRTRQF
jgi:hypothetical protein